MKLARELSDQQFNGTLVQSLNDSAFRIEPLRNSKDKVGFDQRTPSGDKQVVELGAGLPSNAQDILKALGGYQGHPRTLALEHGVRGYGRAGNNFRRIRVLGVRWWRKLVDAFQNRLGRVFGCRPALVHHQSASLESNKVGERATRVHSHAAPRGHPWLAHFTGFKWSFL